jgi:pimeloyl-ACP methyl ester carboxylesterase
MKTLREIAVFLKESSEPISLRVLGERTGFFDISLRVLSDYLESIPVPNPDKDIVERVCPNRLALHIGGLKIPYCSNKSPEKRDTTVRRAVVVIHGNGRNAPGYYRSLLDAANSAGKLPETIIIAPHFLIEDDVNTHNPGNDVPFWTTDSWKQGDDLLSTSNNPRVAQLSSFGVVDIIMAQLADRNVFPNLHDVVLVGHSARGQFVQRYAAANPESLPTRYIVANPSSYLYMDKQRGVAEPLPQFAVPGPLEQSLCPMYNRYKYGLEGLNTYMQVVGESKIRSQYAQRQVVYLLGEEDNDPDHKELDKDCPAMFQGAHRLERGTIFYSYIQCYYGAVIQAQHTKVTVPGVGHSAGAIFNSPEGIKQIFG